MERPDTVNTTQLQHVVCHVQKVLCATVHVHRWANVIVVSSGDWLIIDCEFARRMGTTIPPVLHAKCDWSDTCTPSTDLFCIGRMLSDLQQHMELDEQLQAVARVLTSKSKNFKQGLTADRVFERFPWLAAAGPQGSPAGGG